jgi:hypothetical protein
MNVVHANKVLKLIVWEYLVACDDVQYEVFVFSSE